LRERIKIKAKQTTNKNTNKTKTVKEIFEIFANWQSLYRHTLYTHKPSLIHTHHTHTEHTHKHPLPHTDMSEKQEVKYIINTTYIYYK